MNFRTGAVAMLAGTLVSQALPLLAAPVLARLYTPQAFGLQTLFMGVAGSLAVLATCRLDLAMVLPDADAEAMPIVAVVVVAASVVTLAAALGVWLVSLRDGALSEHWIWMVPLMIATIVLTQLCVAMASRARGFGRVAAANVANQTTYVAAAVLGGLSGAWAHGLALAKALGQTVAALMLVARHGRDLRAPRQAFRAAAIRATVLRYRQFLLFNTPYSFIGSVARDVPIYLFTAWTALAAAGHFGLARTVLLAPTLLTSNALSQVFYREAVGLKGTPRLEGLTLALLRLGLVVGAPLFAFCAVWADRVFVVLFGERWLMAGQFAMLMAPAAWMSVQTGWPERLFEVHQRQGVSFSVQLGSDLLTAGVFAACYLATGDALVAIGAFAVCNVLYHHAYLAAIFRVSGFRRAGLGAALAAGWGTFLMAVAVLAGLRLAMGSGAQGWLAGGFLAAAAAGALAWRRRGDLRVSPQPTGGLV